MENNKRVYPPTQLCIALDARVLKCYMWICGWKQLKYYPRQFAKAVKMSEKDCERCIQTLVNINLVDVSKVDGNFILTANAEQNQKYYNVKLEDVLESNGIQIADEVTWNKDEEDIPTSNDSIDKLSNEELQRMILRLQANLNERKETEKKVVTCEKNYDYDNLPF